MHRKLTSHILNLIYYHLPGMTEFFYLIQLKRIVCHQRNTEDFVNLQDEVSSI